MRLVRVCIMRSYNPLLGRFYERKPPWRLPRAIAFAILLKCVP